MVLKGKANSPAKTFLGEVPALLTLDSSRRRSAYHSSARGPTGRFLRIRVNEGLVWKVGDHSEEGSLAAPLWELCDAQAFQENPRAGEAGQLKSFRKRAKTSGS